MMNLLFYLLDVTEILDDRMRAHYLHSLMLPTNSTAVRSSTCRDGWHFPFIMGQSFTMPIHPYRSSSC